MDCLTSYKFYFLSTVLAMVYHLLVVRLLGCQAFLSVQAHFRQRLLGPHSGLKVQYPKTLIIGLMIVHAASATLQMQEQHIHIWIHCFSFVHESSIFIVNEC